MNNASFNDLFGFGTISFGDGIRYTVDQVVRLARQLAADYAAACTGPTIRGKKGEKFLRGTSYAEVLRSAEPLGLTRKQIIEMTVDLSTTDFDDLPAYWQRVNFNSAISMISIMQANGGPEVILGLNFQDCWTASHFGALVHQAWLAQPENSWAKGGPLDVPFELLPLKEQDKDIQQLRSLQCWLKTL